jgi:hypothetical protein
VAVSLSAANAIASIRLKDDQLEINLPEFEALVHNILMAYV